MPVEILSQTYTNQFKNLVTVDWLLGNVGDWQKLTLECAFAVKREFTQSETITLGDPNKMTLNTGETWKELGFYVGLDVIFEITAFIGGSPATVPMPLTIISILGNEMEIAPITGGTFGGWGTNSGVVMPGTKSDGTKIVAASIKADVQPQGIQLDYAHISNASSPSGNIASFIDGTKTSLVLEDSDSMTMNSVLPFTHQLNFKSGLSLERGTVTYNGYIASPFPTYNYTIDIWFMLSPFYDDINNLIDNVAPDVVLGTEALTDIFQVRGFPVYNNHNISITNDIKKTVQLGNTGWFDENFNQLPNPFTFTDVVYTNSAGVVVPQLDYTNETTVTTTISGLTNFVDAKFQYGFLWTNINEEPVIIDGVETIPGYKENEYPYHKNQKVSTGGNGGDLGDVFPLGTFNPATPYLGYSRDGTSGIDVSSVSFIQNGTDIDISITFVPSAPFAAFMADLSENERQYVLWVSIGDPAPDTNKGDRVSLKLDFNTMDTYVEPIGAWDGMTIDFLNHTQAYNDTPVPCGNEMFVEDDILAKIGFQIDSAVDAATIPVPSSIEYGILMNDSVTGAQYVLDNSSIDLTQYPDPTQYNYDESRGFKLGDGNNKNWFKIEHNAAADSGTLKGVLGYYGFKVRWEDWIKRLPTPPNAFYDNTLQNNGLSNDWYNYFNTTDWKMFFFVNTTTQLGIYQNLKSMSIVDYDQNADIDVSYTYNEDNNGVIGAVLNGGTDPISGTALGVIIGDYVWLTISYRWVGGGPPPTDWASQIAVDAGVYGVNCIEVDGGAGQKSFRQLSSIWDSEADNPMVPIPTETLAKVTWVGISQIQVESRIETSKLISATRYKVSGREGCK